MKRVGRWRGQTPNIDDRAPQVKNRAQHKAEQSNRRLPCERSYSSFAARQGAIFSELFAQSHVESAGLTLLGEERAGLRSLLLSCDGPSFVRWRALSDARS